MKNKTLIIQDRVYGEIVVTEPVIVELIESKPFQRLKNISQDGAANYIQPVRNVTRYEHSIGVWYLSSLYQRSVEEQIACLLHDVSHTAFSHVIDFVVKNAKHEYADEKLAEIINQSEIPGIIAKYGFDLAKVLDKQAFPLLENNLPDLSVDRWDYFMRDGSMVGFMTPSLIQEFLNGVKEKNEQFYFVDQKLAAVFSILFVNFSRLLWLDPTSHGAFFLLAESVKLAVADGLVTEADFFTNDKILKAKLATSKNPKIQSYLARLKPGNEFVYAPESEAEFFGPNKTRFVDPLVLHEGKLVRLTELTVSLKYFFEEYSAKYKVLGVKAA